MLMCIQNAEKVLKFKSWCQKSRMRPKILQAPEHDDDARVAREGQGSLRLWSCNRLPGVDHNVSAGL